VVVFKAPYNSHFTGGTVVKIHFLFTAEDAFVETGGCFKQLDALGGVNI